MLRSISSLLLVLVALTSLHAQSEQVADVAVTAKLERSDANHAELVIIAQIADGLHIYAQSQPKPFLATKISTAASSTGITAVGDFIADRKPIQIRHPQLNTDLHEYEGTVQWRATVVLADNTSRVKIDGNVFAQACEEERCFAPQTYSFTAELDTEAVAENPFTTVASSTHDVNTVSGSFSVSQLQVDSAANTQSAWTVIPLAFVAGFLLNFMPCVLPVVGLKLLSFVQQANSDRKRILLMNLAYTAGLLSVMLILATLAVFAGFGWGEQFSSVGFTVTLSAIVFAFGLSFLGVWEIPMPGFIGASSGQAKQEGYVGAFSKGILSTLLATPCSGPFLGAALAWAVTQPTYLTYSVFAAVGIGMASPYLVVGLFPATIRFLPKPGNWMVTFKQTMGFVMLATVVYLLSFMPVAAVVPTILLLLGIGLALWFASRTPIYAPGAQQLKAWSIAAVLIVATTFASFGWLQGVMQLRFERAAVRLLEKQSEEIQLTSTFADQGRGEHIAWQSYSPELLESLVREGKPVFVDFTADWCLTCKANEATAIETDAVAEALRDTGAVALRADKTEPNPAVDDLLRKLGNSAASIPFYAVFSAEDPGNPITFDGVFASPAPVVDALRTASTANKVPDPQHVSLKAN
jgi:thiol:disulfide interchange protein DsbD